MAKRAVTVAAAGGHNVLMIGSPGTGKTLLAQRLATILPDLSPGESIETTQIYKRRGTAYRRPVAPLASTASARHITPSAGKPAWSEWEPRAVAGRDFAGPSRRLCFLGTSLRIQSPHAGSPAGSPSSGERHHLAGDGKRHAFRRA